MEAKMMEQRAKYVAKAKAIALEPEINEDKPKKSGGGKVRIPIGEIDTQPISKEEAS